MRRMRRLSLKCSSGEVEGNGDVHGKHIEEGTLLTTPSCKL